MKDCIKYANENRDCFLSTLEDDQPRVRPVRMAFADETGFYFATVSIKNFYRQLKKNKKIEVCFYPLGLKVRSTKYMRVAGEIEILEDGELKEKVLSSEPPMKREGELYDKSLPASPIPPIPKGGEIIPFRIYKGEAYFWIPNYNFRESEVKRIQFGYI